MWSSTSRRCSSTTSSAGSGSTSPPDARRNLTFAGRRVTMNSRMAIDVVGRDEERGSLHAFLDRRATVPAPSALALEGESGIGKSTLWRAAVDDARARGLRVLSARPAESEQALAHAGLGDLFEGALDDVLPALSPPRRHALEVALLVEDAAGRPVHARALGVAVRNALELLAEDGLVLAIDDLQWLDASTASALGFAVRRLPEARLLLLWTRRLGEPEQSSPIETALEPDRIERVRVGPLSVGAVQQILHERLDRSVNRPTLLRLHDVSGGNPFYALEVARALGADGDVRDPTQPLAVPERLEELVSTRLAGFDGATREGLALASAQARLTLAQLAELGVERAALEPALGENVIEVDAEAVRFTHPLLASVLYQGLTAEERQHAHLRLARVAEEPLARARHLALSTEEPDAELAAALEDAAEIADVIGAPISAAELGEHALRLTPPGRSSDADRRTLATVRAHLAAGEVGRARVLADGLLARAPPGPGRAPAPSLLDVAERHAQEAVELTTALEDTELEASALAGLALIRFNAGEEGAIELAERAHALIETVPSAEAAADAGFSLAHILFWSCRLDDARSLLETLYEQWSERDEREAAYALWYLSLVEFRAGRYLEATELAERSRRLSGQYARDEAEGPQSLYPLTLATAHLGRLEQARVLATETCRRAELHRARVSTPEAMLAVVEFWSGELEAAVERFRIAEAIPDAPDLAEPSMCWWRSEQIEALLEAGGVDEAVDRLAAWEAAARRLNRDWVLAHTTRCRGLAAAARGEVDEALVLLEDAVVRHEAVGDPFGRARALLALGVARRRARQKRPARDAIESAEAGFEQFGAASWAQRARDELGAIGGGARTGGVAPAGG